MTYHTGRVSRKLVYTSEGLLREISPRGWVRKSNPVGWCHVGLVEGGMAGAIARIYEYPGARIACSSTSHVEWPNVAARPSSTLYPKTRRDRMRSLGQTFGYCPLLKSHLTIMNSVCERAL